MNEAENKEIGQITFFLAKEGTSFDSIIDSEVKLDNKKALQTVDFSLDETQCRFTYFETFSKKTNPPWLDFVNEKLSDDAQVNFEGITTTPNGLLLMLIGDRLFAAVFGRSAPSWLDAKTLEPDFGIKTAMNMCGNEEIRQTRSQSNTVTPTHIDRQVSRPSDTHVFGLSEAEDLRYISAHIKGEENTTLQGRDSLTVKVIGKEKLDWSSLVDRCATYLERFASRDFVDLFPNYRNFQPATDEEQEALDLKLLSALEQKDYAKIDLCIPEFLSDEDYSFSFTNRGKKDNNIHAFLSPNLLETEVSNGADALTIKQLTARKIFAYSHAEDRILPYKKWSVYNCLVFEAQLDDGSYFILSAGRWTKVDPDFHKLIIDFIENEVTQQAPEEEFCNIDIFDKKLGQNREDVFNDRVVEIRSSCVKFDKAKLQIGTGAKNKEFCDILDLQDDGQMRIINVKQFKGADSVNYLFSQSQFYCEAFLTDETFLADIRKHVESSPSAQKADYLAYIKPFVGDNHGKDYTLCLWLLFDNKQNPSPTKADMPIIAQYELKLMHDRLRKILKFPKIVLRFIPVQTTKFMKAKSPKKAK